MIQSLIGKKIDQTQGFLEDGKRVPLSVVSVAGNIVSQVKTQDHEGYNAIQLGFGVTKRATKPMAGHIKKAGLTKTPRFFAEIRADETPLQELGSELSVSELFEPGDIVDVTGTSKGKGFAGVVKRFRFHGGPKTHGQSDRHRARGSSGSGTTPGRVYRGKKMAGRMGNEQVTVKNLEILGIDGDTLLVRGLIPGAKGSIVVIKKVGKNKKFMPLWSEKPAIEMVEEEIVESDATALAEGDKTVSEDTQTSPETVQEVETAPVSGVSETKAGIETEEEKADLSRAEPAQTGQSEQDKSNAAVSEESEDQNVAEVGNENKEVENAGK